MYLFHKRKKAIKKKDREAVVLPRDKAYRNIVLGGTCPKCTNRLERLEESDQNVLFECVRCYSRYTVKQLKDSAYKKRHKTRLKAFTLVDRSGEKNSPYDYTRTENMHRNKDVESDVLATVRLAMRQEKMLKFVYPRGNALVDRLVEPYKLDLDGSKNVILYGYCSEAESIRIFKLAKMENLAVSEYDFKLQWKIEDSIDAYQKNKTEQSPAGGPRDICSRPR
jgi:Zn ribbon nucleic-acid-binding protein